MRTLSLYDLDGTLANDLHRQHYAKDSDWVSYFAHEHMLADVPYGECVELMKCAQESGSEIGYLTARDERSREITTQWLALHGFSTDHLWMKPLNCLYNSADFKALWVKGAQLSGSWDRVVLYENNLHVANAVRRICGEDSVVLCEWQLETFVHANIPDF